MRFTVEGEVPTVHMVRYRQSTIHVQIRQRLRHEFQLWSIYGLFFPEE